MREGLRRRRRKTPPFAGRGMLQKGELHMKRIAGLFLAVVLLLGLAAPSAAADSAPVVILCTNDVNDKGPGEREIMEENENRALAILPEECRG